MEIVYSTTSPILYMSPVTLTFASPLTLSVAAPSPCKVENPVTSSVPAARLQLCFALSIPLLRWMWAAGPAILRRPGVGVL